MDKAVNQTKPCSRCKKDLSLDRFGMSRGRAVGVCKDCKNAYAREWRKSNTTWDQASYHREWRARNREKVNLANKAWRDGNTEKMSAIRASWAARNPERVAEINRRYWRRRLADPAFKVHNRMKARVREALKFGWSGGTFERLGYSAEDLMGHLERQFLKGMTWENMGEWHIDHIIPLASFTITGPDDPELRRAWALPNLRPLWAADNLKKSAKVTHLI